MEQFTFGEGTEVYRSCAATLNGEMFVFGGSYYGEVKQISKVENCALRRIGTLPMRFESGACNTYQSHVLLCFNAYDETVCDRLVTHNIIQYDSYSTIFIYTVTD